MPSFWSFIENDKYKIGCTGQTVYVYNKAGKELARFKDLIYAYLPVISPKGDHFVVKATDGRMAVYSLETLSLVKKFRYSKVDGAHVTSGTVLHVTSGTVLHVTQVNIKTCQREPSPLAHFS